MYGSIRSASERLLRIPAEPAPPPGDESSTRLFRAAPRYYQYLLVTWALRTLIALLALLPTQLIPAAAAYERAITREIPWYFLLQAPLLIAALIVLQRFFSLALLRLDFEKRWYLVTDRSLRVREGVLKVREMTITFANIQNISISQGPLQRLLGIADLRVDTAGGGAQTSEKKGRENLHGVHFRGVNNAEEVRALINRRVRELKGAGLGDHDDEEHAPLSLPHGRPPQFLAALHEIAAEAKALRGAAANYLPSS